MIKAIETEYKNYRFRSRLEARWAVFFDTLGIEYQYEKEGFDLNGTRYLPDFWLPKQDCFIEIKGVMPTCEELGKAFLLSWYSGKYVHILWGDVKEPADDKTNAMFTLGDYQLFQQDEGGEGSLAYLKSKLEERGINPFKNKMRCSHEIVAGFREAMEMPDDVGFNLWNGCNWWAACFDCKGIEIQPHGFFTRMSCECVKKHDKWTEEDGDYTSMGMPLLLNAYKAAQHARFEHGETGTSTPKSRKKASHRHRK